jgi:hypothetical protein
VRQGETDLRPGEGIALHHLERPPQLGRGGLQELAAGGDVEEQAADVEGGAAGPGERLRRPHPAALDQHPVAIPRLLGGGHLDLGHRGDGGQGLAAKAQGGDPLEVVEAADLAGGVAVEGEEGVVAPQAVAVVGDGDALPAAAFELDVNFAGPGVE